LRLAVLSGGGTLVHEDYLPELLTRHRNRRSVYNCGRTIHQKLARHLHRCEHPIARRARLTRGYVESVVSTLARSARRRRTHRRKEDGPGVHQ
jgi:hypothetical protein